MQSFSFKNTITLLLLTMSFSISNCTPYQREKVANLGDGPVMEKVKNPVLERHFSPLIWPEPDDDELESPNPNSLWAPGSSKFFKDRRARKVGDILKVVVKISDRAELDSSISRKRNEREDTEAPTLFGFENDVIGLARQTPNLSNLLDLTGSTSSSGEGEIDREEVIETEVAAMVTQILPNGNLVINGSQEIRVNHELRQITVEGIVRAEDISASNSIDSKMIAEARIAYGGKGLISEMQQPRLGHQLIDLLSPF